MPVLKGTLAVGFLLLAALKLAGCTSATAQIEPAPMASATAVPLMPVTTATDAPVPTLTPTPLPPATATAVPTVTAPPTDTAVPSPIPSATPEPVSVNGMPVSEFILFPPGAVERARTTFAQGQALGRNPGAFSKIGDSVVLTDHYLTRFDSGFYTLGPYAYLQPTIDHFSGSFERYGVGSRVGLHAWGLFDPFWANKDWCQPNESMVACEIRLHNPAFLLIRMGSNDSGAADVFDENMRALIELAETQGVVPVLTTKADRFEGDNRNNEMMRAIAQDYQVPLIEFDLVAGTLPRRGLSGDDVHLTMGDANNYTDPEMLTRGYPVSDLVMLMMLHALREQVVQPET